MLKRLRHAEFEVSSRRIDPAVTPPPISSVVATTRKSFPGTKKVAIKGIAAGGAIPHRLGLLEAILVLSSVYFGRPADTGVTIVPFQQ